MLTVLQGIQEGELTCTKVLIDKVACPPVTPDLGTPLRLCLCCLCLLECHPPVQQKFTELLLYTRHWRNKDNPRQIWFLLPKPWYAQETSIHSS